MAQLKDLIVNGASRFIGDAFTNKIQITTLNAPTSAGGTTYGPGANGKVLKSNGSSVYWADDNNTTYTLSGLGGIGTVSASGTSPLTLSASKSGTAVTITGSVAAATTSTAGLMSAADKVKLNGITESADAVSFTRSLTSGTKIGTITINGSGTDLYCQTNTNTTYTFASGTNGFTVTPSGGTAQTVTVTPSITNNITGSGASGYLTKFNGTNTITNGPALGSSTTTFLRNDGTWATPPVTSVAGKTGAVALGTLTIGGKTYNGSSNTTIEIADLGLASTTTFLGITSTNLSDGSTTNPITVTIGPTTGSVTASNGSVVMEQDSGEEFIWTGSKWNLMGLASSWALANHIHGNILNNGTITSTGVALAANDRLLFSDNSNSGKIERSSITFDGSTTTSFLSKKGTWEAPPNASTSQKGIVQLVDSVSSTATDKAATAKAVKTAYDAVAGKVNKSGDTMTGALTLKGDPTSNLHAATKQYVDNILTTNDALVFKGTLGTSNDGATVTSLPDTHKQGWTYKVVTAGTYAGQECEIGDTIYCIADGTTANNAHWTVVQTNIDGYVIGPATSTTNGIAIFTGTTGKAIKDSGFTIATSVPANAVFTDTNKYHKTGSWSGLTYTAQAINSADELKFTIPSATTSIAGAVQLSSATNSTSETLAATAKAVKAAYDLAASKTSNTGTVTSVAASGSGGITISGSPITTSGTITVGLNLSKAINELEKEESNLSRNDYIISENGNEVNGSIATFEVNSEEVIKKLTVNIEPVQSGSGDPSPTNVRPISGWTGCNIHVSPTTTGGTVYSITFPTEAGTVYGGTLDVTSGVLTVDRIMITKNTSTMNNTSKYPGWKKAGVSICVPSGFNGVIPDSICNILPSTTIYINMVSGAYYDTLFFAESGYTQTELKKLAIDCQIVLPLLSPVQYQFTPQEITMLLGTNNIWADCGDVDIIYIDNNSIYKRKKIGSIFSTLNSEDITSALGYTPYNSTNPNGYTSTSKQTITLTTSWEGSGPYIQNISLNNITANTKVDLQPDASVISQLAEDGVLGLYISNNNGTLTAYAVGEKPSVALTIQCTTTEVE